MGCNGYDKARKAFILIFDITLAGALSGIPLVTSWKVCICIKTAIYIYCDSTLPNILLPSSIGERRSTSSGVILKIDVASAVPSAATPVGGATTYSPGQTPSSASWSTPWSASSPLSRALGVNEADRCLFLFTPLDDNSLSLPINMRMWTRLRLPLPRPAPTRVFVFCFCR
ncbi:hypothetical protein BJV78DRAFT_1227303 [Lactifluus subvellereus]|nr:hypothetical protein BJV78DRAFT_1227303 [Lactifluus subvellereus]